MKKLWMLALLFALTCAPSRAAEPAPAAQPPGPLAAYVAQPDDSYGWVKRRAGKLGKGEYAELILTSQTWRGVAWKHQLFIYKPSQLKRAAQGFLMIEGGVWRESLDHPPAPDAKLPGVAYIVAAAAEQMQAPVAVLLQVPHQPLFDGLVEDQIISHTFVKFIETGDVQWPLLLPMVKSAVRGMDAVQEFTKTEWSIDVERFLVTGASKRGWTTWLTAAIDPRVNVLAPMVIDILNMEPQMRHQMASFGEFSEQLVDYTEKGLPRFLATPPGRALAAIVDPFSYRADLKQPKLIILGTNDRYWPVDALNVYWTELEGEKHIMYVPNVGHSLNDQARLVGSLTALHRAAAEGKSLPQLDWSFAEADGKLQLTVTAVDQPQEVRVWLATAPTRDFRDARWVSHATSVSGDSYTFETALPTSGYAALFGEAVFEGETLPFYLSTTIKVVEAGEK